MKRLIMTLVLCASLCGAADVKKEETELQKYEKQLQVLIKEKTEIIKKYDVAIIRIDAIVQYLKSKEAN